MKKFKKKLVKLNWFKWLLSIFSATDDIPYTAEEFVQKAKNSDNFTFIQKLLWLFWGYFFVLFFTSIYLMNNSDTLFNVTAQTETLQVTTYKNSQFPDWAMDDATIIDDVSDKTIDFTGTLTINEHSLIEIERFGDQETYISIESEKESAAKIYHNDGEIEILSNSIVIEIKKPAYAITLPLDGVITIGKSIKEGMHSFPLLLSGVVSISDKAVVSREYYSTEPRQLKIGDIFQIHEATTQSSGFIRIENNHGILVTYSGKGKAGVISRYKSEPIYMENNIWSKLSNDDTLVIFWVSLIILYSGTKIAIRINLNP